MTTRTRWAAAAVAAAALTALPACGTGDSTGADRSSTPAPSAAPSTPAAASAAELDAVLATFFDPAVPAADKTAIVENGAARAALLAQFNGMLAGYPLTADVDTVAAVDGDTVTATAQVTGPHGGAPIPLTFERADGTWHLADESTCQILAMGSLTCP
ncbi:hypothetical protein [Rhodococcus rhodochrous]|uniref:Lipoprotein n=1 Tax=Rhodococcus rhodochrous KG-21 TaxID=1441923 RepID=A0A0M8PCJ2_RHORH|nr:hypothetical protein [Rhodococcus rhodochrous]KOS53764.1 lipoprotein [Rhodococcus rhodochrous KG-21]